MKNGICVLRGRGNGGSVGIAAGKAGYYGSSGYQLFFTKRSMGRWLPWNQRIEIALKPLGNPIPMYARKVDLIIPAGGKKVAFDFTKGDWVHPHGKGENSQIFFTWIKSDLGKDMTRFGEIQLFDFKLTVHFPNDGDGIQSVLANPSTGSVLRLPGEAPIHGYDSHVVKRMYQRKGTEPPHSDIRLDQNYFFRVQTQKNNTGEITSALYGKIHGDFVGFDHGRLTFTYYLNPEANSRNMEFDPQKKSI